MGPIILRIASRMMGFGGEDGVKDYNKDNARGSSHAFDVRCLI